MSSTRLAVCHRGLPSRPSWGARFLWLCLAIACPLTQIWGDDEPDADSMADEAEMEEAPPPEPSPMRRVRKSVVEDGPGVIGNIGFAGLKTFGREDSIAPVEVLPYMLLDEDFLFSDVRGFISTEGNFGGNFGVGYRRLVPNQNAWYGLNAFYDVDDTSGNLFHQLGFGVEAAFNSFEFRSNAYFPVGDTSQSLESEAVNARFVGNQIVFDQRILQGYALRGVDAEVGYVLPIPKLGEHSVLRWFVGGYFFSGSGNSESINGFQTRAEAQIATAVTTHVQFSKDDEYGSNVMVGLSLDLPFGESHPTASWRRNTPTPFRFVHRNYNVILDRRDESQNGVVAFNPRTGSAYRVAHVNTSSTGTGDGNFDNPYDNLAAARATNADILFVHAGSEIHESIQLGDGQRLLGDSGNHWIELPNADSARMPTLNSGAATPRITGINGTAITLGNGSQVAGFQIDHIQGDGIVGSGVTGGTIRDVTFDTISGDAVRLTNAAGEYRLTNLSVNNIQGSGLVVSGGDVELTVQTAELNHIGGDGVRLQGVTGGQLNLFAVTAADIGQSGLELTDVDADVTTSNLSITESDQAGISITGGAGTYLFADDTVLENVAGGFRMTDSAAALTAEFLDVSTSTAAAGVYLEDATGDLQFDALVVESTTGPGVVVRDVDALTITDGALSTAGAAAFDAQDSNLAVNFTSVSVDDGPFGLRLVDVTGSFTVQGLDSGEIQKTDVGAILNNAGTVFLQNMKFTNNATAIASQNTELLRLAGITVTGSTGYAIDSLNDDLLSVQNSTFSANGAIDGGTIRVRADTAGTYRSEFLSNSIVDVNGTPILFASSGAASVATLDTTVSGNTIVASRGGKSGVDVNWNGPTGVTISGNTFTLTGGAMTGVRVETPSASDSLSATINSNTMNFSGSSSVGVNVIAAGESNLQLQANQISFSASGGTGLRFDLSKTTSTWLAVNTITDTGSGATGINFVEVADLSRLQFDGNSILLQSSSSAIDRGIVFGTINGTVQLFGTVDNTVSGATDPFFLPTGRSSGSFPINGVLVP